MVTLHAHSRMLLAFPHSKLTSLMNLKGVKKIMCPSAVSDSVGGRCYLRRTHEPDHCLQTFSLILSQPTIIRLRKLKSISVCGPAICEFFSSLF